MFHINVIIHVYGGEETGNGCGSSWVNDKNVMTSSSWVNDKNVMTSSSWVNDKNVIKCDGTGMGFKDCFNLRGT